MTDPAPALVWEDAPTAEQITRRLAAEDPHGHNDQWDFWYCTYCFTAGRRDGEQSELVHEPDCLWTLAVQWANEHPETEARSSPRSRLRAPGSWFDGTHRIVFFYKGTTECACGWSCDAPTHDDADDLFFAHRAAVAPIEGWAA